MKIVFRFLPKRSPEHPESIPAPSPSTLAQGCGGFKALRAFRRTTDTQGTSTAGRQFFVRQNGVKMVPEESQNGASSESNAFEATKRQQIAPGSGFCQCQSSLLELPRDPEGLQKSIKNRLFAKRTRFKHVFLLIFVQTIVLLVFFIILCRFLMKNL